MASFDDLHHDDAVLGWHGARERLTEYVLVDHMRTIGAEFDPHATALDHHTWRYRINNAIFQREKKLGLDRHTNAYTRVGNAIEAWYGEYGPRPHFGISFCDRQQIVDAILGLSDADATALGKSESADPEATEEERAAIVAAAKVVTDRLVALIGKRVTIDAFYPIQITQGTVEGQTPATGTYDPAVEGAEELQLSVCAISDAGVRIEALDKPPGSHVHVATVRNGLSKPVLVTPSENKLRLTAHTVKPTGNLLLYGNELAVSWTVSVKE